MRRELTASVIRESRDRFLIGADPLFDAITAIAHRMAEMTAITRDEIDALGEAYRRFTLACDAHNRTVADLAELGDTE